MATCPPAGTHRMGPKAKPRAQTVPHHPHPNTGAALASEDGHAGQFAQPPMPRFAAAGVGAGLGQGLISRLGQRPAAAVLGPAAAGALPWSGARRGVADPLFPAAAAGAHAPHAARPSVFSAAGEQPVQTSHHHSYSSGKMGSAAILANAAKLAKVGLGPWCACMGVCAAVVPARISTDPSPSPLLIPTPSPHQPPPTKAPRPRPPKPAPH